MPSSRRSRTRPHKCRIPVIRTFGKELRMGRQETDAVSGWDYPVAVMVKQRGGLVSRRFRDGSLDDPDKS